MPFSLMLFLACPPSSLTCGSGTHEKNGECVADAVEEETGDTLETETGVGSGLDDTVETAVDTATPDTGEGWVDPVDLGIQTIQRTS